MKTGEEILEIAKDICESEKWEWIDPSIVLINDQWQVTTNSSNRGGNAIIHIDKEGNTISKIFSGR